jgi:hypothetical protein
MRATARGGRNSEKTRLGPSFQPRSASPRLNAFSRAVAVTVSVLSHPIRRIRPPCCAHAASGHTAVAPPRSVMNSRRRMVGPPARAQPTTSSIWSVLCSTAKIGRGRQRWVKTRPRLKRSDVSFRRVRTSKSAARIHHIRGRKKTDPTRGPAIA